MLTIDQDATYACSIGGRIQTNLNGSILIASDHGPIIVRDRDLIRCVFHLKRLGPRCYQGFELHRELKNITAIPDKAIDFTLQAKLVHKVHGQTGDRLIISIDTDDPVIKQHLSCHIRISFGNRCLFTEEPCEATLLLRFRRFYRGDEFRSTRDVIDLNSPDVINGYFIADKFFIDGLYNARANTPCHFCHIEHYIRKGDLTNLLYESESQGAVDGDISTDPNFRFYFSDLEYYTAAFQFGSRISSIFDASRRKLFCHDVSAYKIIDLINGKTSSGQACHGLACDCQRRDSSYDPQ